MLREGFYRGDANAGHAAGDGNGEAAAAGAGSRHCGAAGGDRLPAQGLLPLGLPGHGRVRPPGQRTPGSL